MEQKTAPKPNLLAQFAKNKLEAQNTGKSFGNLGAQPNRFPRPENHKPLAKRGGRNGQGKP